ncbi:MAG: hypothetical protein BWY85_00024 [Firmicutes bacterium ADurb.Bin506]|nr:MAG: hypothetical protein BWY85_00024 [Firmicutes bacterium ADurb.Bin506]
MYLPALPTLDQLKAACPIGPWPGDERLREELAHMNFMGRLLNTVCCILTGVDYALFKDIDL